MSDGEGYIAPVPSRLAPRFVETSVSSAIYSYGLDTLVERRISCISGPAGIGKSQALTRLAHDYPKNIVAVTITDSRAGPVVFLRCMLDGVCRVFPNDYFGVPLNGRYDLVFKICEALRKRINVTRQEARERRIPRESTEPLLLVVDESQRLNRRGFEESRNWTDCSYIEQPYPVALMFVGNTELLLTPGSQGHSQISPAFGDRLLHSRTFVYGDVKDDDLIAVAKARGPIADEALDLLLKTFSAPQAYRSVRTLDDIITDARDRAGGGEIGVEHVEPALGLQIEMGKLGRTLSEIGPY